MFTEKCVRCFQRASLEALIKEVSLFPLDFVELSGLQQLLNSAKVSQFCHTSRAINFIIFLFLVKVVSKSHVNFTCIN